MLNRVRHALPHLLMLGASLALYGAAMQIEGGRGGRLGPDFWPEVVIAVMGLLCLYEVVRRLAFGPAPAAPAAAAQAQAEAAPQEDEAEQPRLLGAGVALVVGFVLAVPWLGFFTSTLLFLAGFAWIGGFRRPLLNLAVAAAGALLLVFLFMRVAYISLPLGEGVFRQLSLLLMTWLGVK